MKLYIFTIVMCLIILSPAQVSTDKDCATSHVEIQDRHGLILVNFGFEQCKSLNLLSTS